MDKNKIKIVNMSKYIVKYFISLSEYKETKVLLADECK